MFGLDWKNGKVIMFSKDKNDDKTVYRWLGYEYVREVQRCFLKLSITYLSDFSQMQTV